jgi:hypothetical protein
MEDIKHGPCVLKMEAAGSSEMLARIREITLRYIGILVAVRTSYLTKHAVVGLISFSLTVKVSGK